MFSKDPLMKRRAKSFFGSIWNLFLCSEYYILIYWMQFFKASASLTRFNLRLNNQSLKLNWLIIEQSWVH